MLQIGNVKIRYLQFVMPGQVGEKVCVRLLLCLPTCLSRKIVIITTLEFFSRSCIFVCLHTLASNFTHLILSPVARGRILAARPTIRLDVSSLDLDRPRSSLQPAFHIAASPTAPTWGSFRLFFNRQHGPISHLFPTGRRHQAVRLLQSRQEPVKTRET